jgi:hypothetical protein
MSKGEQDILLPGAGTTAIAQIAYWAGLLVIPDWGYAGLVIEPSENATRGIFEAREIAENSLRGHRKGAKMHLNVLYQGTTLAGP